MFKEKITEVSNATQAGSVLSFLNEILDALQETEVFQENEELMHEIGEAMGSLADYSHGQARGVLSTKFSL